MSLAKKLSALTPEKRAALMTRLRENPQEYGLFPLSFAQERLWLAEQISPGTANYNMPAAVELRGELDIAALEAALSGVLERHDALRSAFLSVDGTPMQVVVPYEKATLAFEDLSMLEGHAQAAARCDSTLDEARKPFDLGGGRLLRSKLYRLASDHHLLLLTLHHIVSDDWSHGVLVRELEAGYRAALTGAAPPARPVVQYADFVRWQREWLTSERLTALTQHVSAQLRGAPELLALPLDRARPAIQAHRGAKFYFEIDGELARAVERLARERNATLFMVLLAAFESLLMRYSGSTDIVVATPIANRNQVEVEGLIGLFFNTLVLRGDLSGNPSFEELIARVRSTALDAFAHQDLPFATLVDAVRPSRSLSHDALVQAMFILQNAPRAELRLPRLSLEVVEVDNGTSQLDLICAFRDVGGKLEGYFHYDSDLFEPATLARLATHYRELLRAAVAAPSTRLSALPLLSARERGRALRDWNATSRKDVPNVGLHELFEQRADATPLADAVIAKEQTLSYGELDRLANGVAKALIELGARPERNVGICLRPGPSQVVAALAVLKAGSAYVPIDPSYPADRLAFMLSDSRAAVLLTDAELLGQLPTLAVPTFCIDRDRDRAPPTETRPRWAARGEALAYVIYTSGTTGQPKGVMVRHAGIVNNIVDLNQAFEVGSRDRVLALSSFSFDMSVYEIFGILAAGGAVVMTEAVNHRDPAHWVELIQKHAVTIWNSAPALVEMLVEHAGARPSAALPSLRLGMLGGDWVSVSLPERLARTAPNLRLVVLGGATELSIHSIVYPIREVDPNWTSIPYGRPMANQLAYLLDSELNPVPVGVLGELYLGGEGVARGYHARPALTAERFVPDPFASHSGARMYRTGDLARYREDGTIILVGRIDHQVKIRGHRIELGEIEAVLRDHPEIEDAVVAARPGANGERALSAFVIAAPELDPEGLLEHVRRRVPSYMVPAQVVRLERFPLSPNGKVDRRALPTVMLERSKASSRAMTPIERVVSVLFRETLGLPQVQLEDDFFVLGGNSLGATRLVSQIRDVFQVELPVRQLFEAPTLVCVAAHVEALARAAAIDVAAIAAVFEQVEQLSEDELVGALENHSVTPTRNESGS
jgi:amino acid adenylation domain-containing protein